MQTIFQLFTGATILFLLLTIAFVMLLNAFVKAAISMKLEVDYRRYDMMRFKALRLQILIVLLYAIISLVYFK